MAVANDKRRQRLRFSAGSTPARIRSNVERLKFGPGFHAEPDGQVDIDAYDRYLGRWSRLFVPALLQAADIQPGARVLDLATGPGEVARQLHNCMVFGADIAEPMLRSARSRGLQRVVGADAQALPFADSVLDRVICQLGLRFLPDRLRALREVLRVFRPEGRGTFSTLGQPEGRPCGATSPRRSRRSCQTSAASCSYLSRLCDPYGLATLLEQAGFRERHVSTEVRTGSLGSIETYWRDVERGIGMLPQAYRVLSGTRTRAGARPG